jgi:hypothetical protein
LVCGLSGTDPEGDEHYLNLQRDSEAGDPNEDWGVYVEFDDQINGGYNRVKGCRLTRALLVVELAGQLETWRGSKSSMSSWA